MTTWGGGQQYPDPNQAYYAGQPGYPPPGYGGAPPPGYPGAYPPGAPPAPGGYPAAPPPTGYPGGPPPAGGYPGFQVPPSQPPYGDPYSNQGENLPFSQNTGVYSGTDRDEEDLTAKGFDFTDKSIRRGFIRKVYSILMVQLSITLAFICWFVYHRPTKIFIHSHPELLFISLILLLVTLITLACCGDVRRKAPMNFIFLFIFTLAESFFLATTSSRYDSDIVLMAVGITAAVCLGLTLFAFQTKWDFTMMGGILFVALIILFLFGNYGGTSYDAEDPSVKGFDFNDKSIRRGFIRKVYSILMVQLSITLVFICWFVYHRPTQRFVQSHPELFIISLVLVFVALITLACCGEVRRKSPMNFIFLFIFTLAESFMLATTASTYKSEEVVMAVGITAAVCLGLTLFAFQTKWDFTVMGGILFVAVIILFIFGIVTIFVHTKVVKLVYASLGALIFSVYLIYDTQLMMGGQHKYSISPEEYVFAALNLYVDIINIFMYILTIIGSSRD